MTTAWPPPLPPPRPRCRGCGEPLQVDWALPIDVTADIQTDRCASPLAAFSSSPPLAAFSSPLAAFSSSSPPPPAAFSPASSPPPSSSASSSSALPQPGDALSWPPELSARQKLPHYLKQLSVDDIKSGRLCSSCVKLLVAVLTDQLHEEQAMQDQLMASLGQLELELDTDEHTDAAAEQLAAAVAALEREEQRLLDQLADAQSALDELIAFAASLSQQEEEEEQTGDDDAKHNKNNNCTSNEFDERRRRRHELLAEQRTRTELLLAEHEAVSEQLRSAELERRRLCERRDSLVSLCRTNERLVERFKERVCQAAFFISQDSFKSNGQDHSIGTINGFRLGRLPERPVDWAEINAAWGEATLLLSVLAEQFRYAFVGYALHPVGSFSRVERLADKTSLRLHWNGLSTRSQHEFDAAMAAYLHCVAQLVGHLGGTLIEIPMQFDLALDTVRQKKHGASPHSVRFTNNSLPSWTQALSNLLICLKYFLACWAKQGSLRST